MKSRPKKLKERNAPVWLKILIFLHVIAITSWALPKAAPATLNGSVEPKGTEWLLWANDIFVKTSPLQLYLLSTGTWQSWDMFSPNPASEDIWSDAEIVYKDGTKQRFQYPRMYLLPIVQKYVKERYRKFFEHANTDPNLWPYFARALVRLHPGTPDNPPETVLLHRHWYDIPKALPFDKYCAGVLAGLTSGSLTASTLIPPEPRVPTEYNDYVYFEYAVNDPSNNEQH